MGPMADLYVNVLTSSGVKALRAGDLDEEERSLAASHVNAATHYRDTGDERRLVDFQGVAVGGHELETDPEMIEYLAAQGQLDFDDFYESE